MSKNGLLKGPFICFQTSLAWQNRNNTRGKKVVGAVVEENVLDIGAC
jgi:hypothetical protein